MTVPVVRQTAEWPQRNAAPADYATKADAVGASLPATISDINAAVSYINDQVTTAIELSEANLEAAASGFGNRMYDTAAAMNADLTPVHGLSAIVMDDPDTTKNGWYYKNGASGTGSWVRLPDQPVTNSRLAGAIFEDVNPQSFVPLAATALGQIVTWIKDGLFDAYGVTPEFQEKVVAGRVAQLSQNNIIPIAIAGSQIALWIDENGLLGAKGLTPSVVAEITSGLPTGQYAPLNAPVSTSLPICTDGRTLFKWRSKVGRWRAGDTTAHLKIGLTGDSWTELNDIPVALRDLLEETFPRAGGGWDSAPSGNKPGGANVTYSGWTWFDGSNVHAAGIPTGIDGHNINTSSDTATLTLTTAAATDISIYYENSTGTFRYSLDGGSYTTVTGLGDGSIGVVSLTGLSDTTHTIQIDTAGNTGTVYLLGFYETRSAAGGIEILRMGNGGLSGAYLSEFVENVQPIAQTLDLDVLIVILGNNDYRYASSTPENYVAALTQLADAYSAANPEIGIVFIAPPDTNGTAVIPLVEYRDAMYEFCILNGYEFYNLHDSMGSWSQENALGQFADNLHMNGNGAAKLANEINKLFLHA